MNREEVARYLVQMADRSGIDGTLSPLLKAAELLRSIPCDHTDVTRHGTEVTRRGQCNECGKYVRETTRWEAANDGS